MQLERAKAANAARRRMYAGPPQSLVGVDVSNTRDRTLAEKIRLDWGGGPPDRSSEAIRVELIAQRFRAERGQCGDRVVPTRLDHRQASKPTWVAECKLSSVVQPYPRPHVRVVVVEAKGARHPQVHDQLEPIIQRAYQELPSPADALNGVAGEQADIDELTQDVRMRVPPCIDNAPPGELGIESPSHRLNFRQLWHVRVGYVSMTAHQIDPDGRPYAPDAIPRKEDVDPGLFFRVDMRAGRVVAAEDFPEARKPAWKIWVDFGPVIGVLQSSAQIKNYAKGELVGRLVVGALNLGSKRIAGFESQFLVLGALDPDGTVRLLALEDVVQPGAPIA